MKPLTIYHYPTCSTCKKALLWLSERNIAVEARDIVKTPPSLDELRLVMKFAELPVAKLFNTSGELYRSMNFKEQLKTLSEEQALSALASHGKLIKRPLILGSDLALVGFQEALYQAKLG